MEGGNGIVEWEWESRVRDRRSDEGRIRGAEIRTCRHPWALIRVCNGHMVPLRDHKEEVGGDAGAAEPRA